MGHLIKRRPVTKAQRGVAMVEFIISLPLMLLLFAAISEFGIMFYTQTTLNSAVNDSVRFLAGNTINGIGNTVITAQDRIDATNLVVYGNITGTGQPLVDGLNASMVTIECVNGSTAGSTGTICGEDAAITSLSAISVKVEIPYVPVLGGMLESLSGVNVSMPLRASAINVSLS